MDWVVDCASSYLGVAQVCCFDTPTGLRPLCTWQSDASISIVPLACLIHCWDGNVFSLDRMCTTTAVP